MPGRHAGGRLDPADLALVAPRRPPGGALFEMHAHASERSLDSGVRLAVLAGQAALRGLDGLCITDHNASWRPEELRPIGEACGILLLPGMELGTDFGHVLVYGLDHYAPELLLIEKLRAIVEYEGAAMVLAHPMRTFHGRPRGWDEICRLCDGVEAINGDHSDSEDGYLIRQAAASGLAVVGGSDAHSRDAVGRVATAFPHPTADIGDVVRQILAQQTAAIDFRPAAPRPPGK